MVFKLKPCIMLCENVTRGPTKVFHLELKTPSQFLAKQPFCTTNTRYIIHSKLSSEVFCSSIKDMQRGGADNNQIFRCLNFLTVPHQRMFYKLDPVPRVNSCPRGFCCCVKLDSSYQLSKIAEILWVNQ